MAAHIHAELMAQYAADARETEKPWVRWEYHNGHGWEELNGSPIWDIGFQYRRKPQKKIMRAWVNLYKDGWACAHNDEQIANNTAQEDRVECREITWEVDQ